MLHRTFTSFYTSTFENKGISTLLCAHLVLHYHPQNSIIASHHFYPDCKQSYKHVRPKIKMYECTWSMLKFCRYMYLLGKYMHNGQRNGCLARRPLLKRPAFLRLLYISLGFSEPYFRKDAWWNGFFLAKVDLSLRSNGRRDRKCERRKRILYDKCLRTQKSTQYLKYYMHYNILHLLAVTHPLAGKFTSFSIYIGFTEKRKCQRAVHYSQKRFHNIIQKDDCFHAFFLLQKRQLILSAVNVRKTITASIDVYKIQGEYLKNPVLCCFYV